MASHKLLDNYLDNYQKSKNVTKYKKKVMQTETTKH